MGAEPVRRRILKPCIDCGALSPASRCARHTADREARRPSYRGVYATSVYRGNRRAALHAAGGVCERVTSAGRCPEPATEVNHRTPLATARTYEEALHLCGLWNLEAVCRDHNPRGGDTT